jgi:ABC-2 type transport system ATP-binding protein
MLQRLGLASAVVAEPEILLLDEPSSALDPAGRVEVLALVRRLAERATVLFSSHVLSDVQRQRRRRRARPRAPLFEGPLDALLRDNAAPVYAARRGALARRGGGAAARGARRGRRARRLARAGGGEPRGGLPCSPATRPT